MPSASKTLRLLVMEAISSCQLEEQLSVMATELHNLSVDAANHFKEKRPPKCIELVRETRVIDVSSYKQKLFVTRGYLTNVMPKGN